jgi:hypothetical protein
LERDILYFAEEEAFHKFVRMINQISQGSDSDKTKERLCHLMLSRDSTFLYQPETMLLIQQFSNLKIIILERFREADHHLISAHGQGTTRTERLCYHRQLLGFIKAQRGCSMVELMGNMLWGIEMDLAVRGRYPEKLGNGPTFKELLEGLRIGANASQLRRLECK